jgi:ATP-dependent Clp protease protease subunit
MNIDDNKRPIMLEINSAGGSVPDGYAVIDSIIKSEAPVYTYIVGIACSMAALISIVGKQRYISPNSYWMQHSSSSLVGDYMQYIKDRTNFLLKVEEQTEKLMRQYTKLNEENYVKIRTGEFWLNAQEALDKGVVDKII